MNIYRIYHLLIVLCSLSIGIKMHFIDIYVSFGILIECSSYDLLVTPYLHLLCFRQKGGQHFFNLLLFPCLEQKKGEKDFYPSFLFIVLMFTPLLMIDKKGEKNLS